MFARYGIELVISRAGSERISALDAQRKIGKTVFGSGWLLASREKAEREKAEREKAIVFELSETEKEIIRRLDANL